MCEENQDKYFYHASFQAVMLFNYEKIEIKYVFQISKMLAVKLSLARQRFSEEKI